MLIIYSYLKTLFPLFVAIVSLLQLLWSSLRRFIKAGKPTGYDPIANDTNARAQTDIPPSPVDSEYTVSDDLEINANGRLVLARTTSRGSVIQADAPPRQRTFEIVEEATVTGLIIVNATALITGSYGEDGNTAAITGIFTWSYTLVLCSLRVFLSQSKWRVPQIWNHTAIIYTVNWALVLPIFRSALIHPRSTMTETLTIAEFCMVSFLFILALTTRKGNKTVMMEWENGIQPSREPIASIFSLMTFGWVDDIVWQGWQHPLTMDDVWNLVPKDKAANVINDYRSRPKTNSLAIHLLKYFRYEITLQCLLAIVAGVFTFAPTMLVMKILEYVENPESAPRNMVWLMVISLPVFEIIRSMTDNMALWIGRRICVQVKAITIGEIYSKALRRKAASGNDTMPNSEDAPAHGRAFSGVVHKLKKILQWKGGENAGKPKSTRPNEASDADDEQANIGTIINLMSVDTFKVSELTSYMHSLFAMAPVQILVSVVLLWHVMGLSAIPGIIIMVLLLPINYGIGRGFNYTFNKMMLATDKRVNITNEVLQNIRIIKYFAWEKRFGFMIDEKREAELNALRSRYLLLCFAIGVYNSVPILITFFSFLVYTVVEEKPLVPSVAFTAISLFMLLRMPLDLFGDMFAHTQEAMVSLHRIEEFLNEDETEKYEQLGFDNRDETGAKAIGFENATLVWGNKSTTPGIENTSFQMLDLSVRFKIGKINVIAGPTGSGKTSMLMGLLGEMTRVKGKVYCPGGRSREDVRIDPNTGLADTVAYVAQSAWLMNASIRDNITFAAPYDEQRYWDVVRVCALERDLEILDHGDETLVGEKGITLSGGQKQRISLARAVYSNSAHILMDDCLSAVDSHTSHWIYHHCIRGALMVGRTCILVTHNTQLCVPAADHVVVLQNGRISAQGPPEEIILSRKLGDDLLQSFKSQPTSANPSRLPSRVPSDVGQETADETPETPKDRYGRKTSKDQIDPMNESMATGAVKWSVIKLYISSMGSKCFWVVALMVFLMQQLTPMATNFWVREWANRYTEGAGESISLSATPHAWQTQMHPKAVWASIATLRKLPASPTRGITVQGATTTSGTVDGDVNDLYYIFGLAIIGGLGALSALMRDMWMFYGSLTASRALHNRLISAVMGAQFKFFDVTPLGQLMNRFSKDLEAVDQEIAGTAIGIIGCSLSIVITIVLISCITPRFLITAAFIAVAFYFVTIFYLRASRDLKRLESVQRSPVYQQFGETLAGITTIRAYGDQRRFIRDNLSKINAANRPFFYLWACNRWLAFRADFLGQAVTFFAGVFVILSIGKIDSGAAGISLSYAMTFTENLLWFVRQYGQNEQNMNSVERVKDYLDIDQEAPSIVEDNRPPESWPSKGGVEFKNYSTRYRADLDPVLRNISVNINPREKVGIVGRTGAGKSSLTLALFRALEADSGRIIVDGVDISTIGLQDLREKITIVPQDPTLFIGTLRGNLDPFDQFTDGQVFEALRRVHLISREEMSPASSPIEPSSRPSSIDTLYNKNIFLDLMSPVTESGGNLSQGQRQLMCLARAMLKRPRILVMDEATASIDYQTDAKIQETIREMTGTVITIAHRLQTIVDYDKVLVLDKGSLVEVGHPWELISNENSQFHSMCASSGDLEILKKTAQKKWEESR